MFKAILIDKTGEQIEPRLTEVEKSSLPDGDVTVRVSYSTLNYKDGLAISGKAPIVRSFPMVPGVDFSGVVEESSNARFKAGDAVILNGFGVGEGHWGGLAEYARVKGDWLIPLPGGMTARHAMALGTAGYTAMLCVMALEKQGVTPDKGEILVTGAGGGVGGVGLLILSHLGYEVAASTGRPEEAEYLKGLGAKTIIPRDELSTPGRPLQKARWAGAIDGVGSHTLANVCAQMQDNGVVTACGLAQGMDFRTTVAPFILRGVILVGINSVYRPLADRIEAWRRLAEEIDFAKLDGMTRAIALADAIDAARDLIGGKIRGRLIVDVSK